MQVQKSIFGDKDIRYDYDCKECGEMEITQSIHDDSLEKCPECGSKEFSKIIGACGIEFKGGGWAKDGYSSTPKEGK